MSYYSGISPRPPKLVYRSSSSKTPYVRPPGWRRFKEARGVFGHKLNVVWKDVGPQIRDLLNAHEIYWTSIDVVRFITDTNESEYKKIHGPVVIWIGVFPGSLRGEEAFRSSNEILGVLAGFDIVDVEVEYRESIYRPSAGPALLKSAILDSDPTVNVRGALSPTLGLSIAAADRPTVQGTMAFYFAEGGESDKILGLTCHHVLFETDDEYVLANDASESRPRVQLLGTDAFNDVLTSIKICIGRQAFKLEGHEERIQQSEGELGNGEDEGVMKKLDENWSLCKDTNRAIEDLEKFYLQVEKEWSEPVARVIGHVRFSPGITADSEGFTEDWSAFELDRSKFTKDAYEGNVLDLHSDKFSHISFIEKMQRPMTALAYPYLPLGDIMTPERMQESDIVDRAGEKCLFVIKNGQGSGVTIGRATGLYSFVRMGKTGLGSMAWAIYNHGCDMGCVDPFSKPGDSGSVIVDSGLGEIGGVIIGGTESLEVTYATPMWWLWSRVKKQFPDAYLCPATGMFY